MPARPHLRTTANSSQLIVNGEPFLMLAGELNNSSLSSAEYMREVWPRMADMHINTLLGSVTWEMIEPTEGTFDFTELDQVLVDAREHGMHLVLLWFGSFKNGHSSYTPSWVKRDVKRFPRAHVSEKGAVIRTIDLISPFNEAAWTADAKAFATLMGHLREVDDEFGTVIMVQVENETGLLGDSRERSKATESLFRSPVPQDLLRYLQSEEKNLHPEFTTRCTSSLSSLKPGVATWQEAFGQDGIVFANEMFMADAFSRYVGKVAAAGKAEYPIPLFTNVWLSFSGPTALDPGELPPSATVGGGSVAGGYPSGGAVPQAMDIWKHNAPALDFISPDIYFFDYDHMCRQFRHRNQPLFIPEQRRDEWGMRRVWLAYATHGAIGCSPFGIDSLELKDAPVTRHYRLLKSISKILLEKQATSPDDVMGFYFDELEKTPTEKKWSRKFGEFEVTVERAFAFGKAGPGSGMLIHQGKGKFLLVGWGFQVKFKSTNPKSTFTNILYSEEKRIDDAGNLHTVRVTNGDERRGGDCMVMPFEEPDYGGFPVSVTIPARTMISECTVYSIEEDAEDF